MKNICNRGHVGQYFLNSRGHLMCLLCQRENSRKARLNPIHQEKREKWRKENYKKIYENNQIWRSQPAERFRDRARLAVSRAVRSGKFTKDKCEKCSDINTFFHHTNGYDKENQFIGQWLCRTHHMEIHVKIREKEAQHVTKSK